MPHKEHQEVKQTFDAMQVKLRSQVGDAPTRRCSIILQA